MLVDFHTHSDASDGALAPSEVVARAREAGVSLLAITDHDTVAGYRQVAHTTAVAGAAEDPLRIIPGVEFSCVWSGVTIHVLGLAMDCDHAAMQAGLAQLDEARQARAQKIAQRLEKLGFPGALEGAMAQAGDSQIGRPHFAAWMLEQGHVDTMDAAFDRFLGKGKPGDVKAFWPELETVVGWIVAAGGVPVLAHPLKYRMTNMKLQRLILAFQAAGGLGLEVSSGRQTADQTRYLQQLAQRFDLEVSVGSDFHRDSTYGTAIGVTPPRMEGMRAVWERWIT